jgi:hypothetical protein
MEHKSLNLKLTIVTSRLAPSAAVSITIAAPDLNWFVLQKLLTERPCGCLSLARCSEYTALVYAMYDDIRDRLVGTPDNQTKSKVNTVSCGFHNGQFIISYTCQSSITAIRKSVGICMSRMSPQKRFQRYSKYIRLLGGSPRRDEFFNCAKRINSTLNPCVFVVAKIKTDKTKEENILSVINNKYPDNDNIESGSKPLSESNARGSTEYHEMKSSGYDSMFAIDYLDSINVPALSTGHSIIIFDKKWSKIKPASIDRYISTKFSKMKDKLIPAVLYSATSRGLLCYPDLRSLMSANPSPSDISKIIKSTLS